ncbi:right-handed parallel beta-helix repeat-containing protein [Chryseosolibacter indicus]|uniref:Alginate lyase family protein n=1 Tax=Chryseosolibacter indicus TaxID=2782351 RepID=A0ABS5VSM3_9BACT|nr:alginate lyase family protein [Chryseosolibacter indicus]MBT1703774.1 alginate lyase family protein [Chryseosolibacter indicus]
MRISMPLFIICLVVLFTTNRICAQKIIHPGLDQTKEDLEYMKNQVLKGEQPWKNAFDKLKDETDLNFIVTPFTHVLRGPYGKPNFGGDDLSKGANMAYNCALLWYITEDKRYAKKAIEVIHKWSTMLWDFDYNDAKLLAGWTGHLLCNAAEILRYTESGWQKENTDEFVNLLLGVYYPLLRFYYTQANGNWDGAIIHSIMAIGVFTDNRQMFDNAIDHFLHAPFNGSVFKYIYPSGQCQESTRDQGHVQLGLGEFAGAARIAYTQGVDLFTIADNRIALGFEYTASFVLGKKNHGYGPISERVKDVRDNYEYVYRHYSAEGLEVPYTKAAADLIRPKASRSILTAQRAPSSYRKRKSGTPKPGRIAYPAGAMEISAAHPPESIKVAPGESLQNALNEASGTGKWVIAGAGIHTLSTTLKVPSGVTLAGEGLRTVLFLDPSSGIRDAIANTDDNMHDVTIRDLVVEGALKTEIPSDPNSSRSYRNGANRGGIIFLASKEGGMKNISFINVTVQNCTYNGVLVSGATNVNVINCDLNENGSSVVPGPKLQHNLLLTHCSNITVKDSRLDTSPFGCGVSISQSKEGMITNCEIARNGYYGVLISESRDISITGNLIEANDRSGVMTEFLYHGSDNISVKKNIIHYNNGYGVESYGVKDIKAESNTYAGNGKHKDQQKLSTEKYIIME